MAVKESSESEQDLYLPQPQAFFGTRVKGTGLYSQFS